MTSLSGKTPVSAYAWNALVAQRADAVKSLAAALGDLLLLQDVDGEWSSVYASLDDATRSDWSETMRLNALRAFAAVEQANREMARVYVASAATGAA